MARAPRSITWFIEILTYHDIANASENEAPVTIEAEAERAFFAYLKNAYHSFLCGDDAMYEQLDKDLIRTFEERDEVVEKELAEVREKNEELRKRLDELQSETSSLPRLEKRKRDLSADLAKFEKLIVKLNAHKDQLLAKLEARRAEEATKADELADAKQARATLQSQLDNQELKPADVERMKEEKAHLRSAAEEVDEEQESFQKKLWELERELSDVNSDLAKRVKEYNNFATKMMLVPRNEGSSGVDFEMKADADAYDRAEDIVQTDIRGVIKLRPRGAKGARDSPHARREGQVPRFEGPSRSQRGGEGGAAVYVERSRGQAQKN